MISIYLSINLNVYINDCDSFEMLFDNDWLQILLQINI